MLNDPLRLSQFFTPGNVSDYMSALIDINKFQEIHFLDPCFGSGNLTISFIDRLRNSEINFKKISLTLFELDDKLASSFKARLENTNLAKDIHYKIYNQDYLLNFISLIPNNENMYTHAILNPPYSKLTKSSTYWETLCNNGLILPNLYAAFLYAVLKQITEKGEIVALVPRSFCNGVYFSSFRKELLTLSSIKSIHLFDSRRLKFWPRGVLQESVILHLEKGTSNPIISLSFSQDERLQPMQYSIVDQSSVIRMKGDDFFIQIPTEIDMNNNSALFEQTFQPNELGFEVSVGPIVEFRMRANLRIKSTNCDLPLISGKHIKNRKLVWPSISKSILNYVRDVPKLNDFKFRGRYFCIVSRFSPKENPFRINSLVVDTSRISNSEQVFFENHIIVFHRNKRSLSKKLTFGLYVYLNSTFVNYFFKQFSGHTQVNIHDLKYIGLPAVDMLEKMGLLYLKSNQESQEYADSIVKAVMKW